MPLERLPPEVTLLLPFRACQTQIPGRKGQRPKPGGLSGVRESGSFVAAGGGRSEHTSERFYSSLISLSYPCLL